MCPHYVRKITFCIAGASAKSAAWRAAKAPVVTRYDAVEILMLAAGVVLIVVIAFAL